MTKYDKAIPIIRFDMSYQIYHSEPDWYCGHCPYCNDYLSWNHSMDKEAYDYKQYCQRCATLVDFSIQKNKRIWHNAKDYPEEDIWIEIRDSDGLIRTGHKFFDDKGYCQCYLQSNGEILVYPTDFEVYEWRYYIEENK